MTENSAALAAVSAGAGERKINICSINEMVTCKICSGYLVSRNEDGNNIEYSYR